MMHGQKNIKIMKPQYPSLSSLSIVTGPSLKKLNLLIHRYHHLIPSLTRGWVCRRRLENFSVPES